MRRNYVTQNVINNRETLPACNTQGSSVVSAFRVMEG